MNGEFALHQKAQRLKTAMKNFPIHNLSFDGHLLIRGFWLYVWEVTVKKSGKRLYYVGRTGDSSSIYASSPLSRMGQHLDLRTSASANMLVRNLKRKGGVTDPTSCEFHLVAIGPIMPEVSKPSGKPSTSKKALHLARRDIVAALERELEQAMRNAGYSVLNEVKSLKPTDPALWDTVREQFTGLFPKLKGVTL